MWPHIHTPFWNGFDTDTPDDSIFETDPRKTDYDADGIPDAYDDDRDGDGIPNYEDDDDPSDPYNSLDLDTDF